jgi:conjugal transfer pilus assembly protein TraF
MAYMVNLISLVLILLTTVTAMAQEPAPQTFYDDSKRGWFWYEVQPDPPPSKEPKKPQKQPVIVIPDMKDYTYETLWNMHPDEFQALLMQFQKKAVMTPSPDNVYDYLTMQDIARKKSLAYANTVAYVNQAHPELTVKDEYPVAAPGRTAKTRLEQGEVDNTLKASSNDFAMLYFFSPDCQFCQAQSQILNFFTAKYPLWQIKRIDIQSQPGLATQFNVQTVPHIVLLYKHSDKAFPVATGVTSMVEMELSIYRAIRLIKGEITPQEWSTYEFQKGGSFDPIVKK